MRLIGKGRKERCTPIARSTLAVLRAWLREPQRGDEQVLFPNAKGERLSVHGVQYLLDKHRVTASNLCPSLKHKRVTVHRLRHTMAMDTFNRLPSKETKRRRKGRIFPRV